MKIYEIEVNLRSLSQESFDLYLHCLKVYIKIYYLACFEVLKSNVSLENFLIQECCLFSLEYFREIANKWEKKSKLFTSQFIGHITRQK